MDKTLQMSHLKEVSVLSATPQLSLGPDQLASARETPKGGGETAQSRFRYLDNFYYFRSLLGVVLLTFETNFQFFLKLKPDLFELVGLT